MCSSLSQLSTVTPNRDLGFLPLIPPVFLRSSPFPDSELYIPMPQEFPSARHTIIRIMPLEAVKHTHPVFFARTVHTFRSVRALSSRPSLPDPLALGHHHRILQALSNAHITLHTIFIKASRSCLPRWLSRACNHIFKSFSSWASYSL